MYCFFSCSTPLYFRLLFIYQWNILLSFRVLRGVEFFQVGIYNALKILEAILVRFYYKLKQ